MRLWKKASQILEEGGNPPKEHPGVPVIVASGKVFLRQLQFGFLRESPNGKNGEAFGSDRGPRPFDVAKPRLRPSWRDAQHYHSPRFASRVEGGVNNLQKFLRLLDVVISGEHCHQRVAACHMTQVNGREPHRHCGVPPQRLNQHAFTRGCGNLFAYGSGLFGSRDRPDALGGNQRLQTRDGLLEHGVLVDDVQKLLRRARAAARPETSAAAPCQDHRVNR